MIVALWKLVKAVGRDDLRNRQAPKVTWFNTDLAEHGEHKPGKAYLMSWPKTRMQGDYCESLNGYICQRSAAALEAPEGNGNQN